MVPPPPRGVVWLWVASLPLLWCGAVWLWVASPLPVGPNGFPPPPPWCGVVWLWVASLPPLWCGAVWLWVNGSPPPPWCGVVVGCFPPPLWCGAVVGCFPPPCGVVWFGCGLWFPPACLDLLGVFGKPMLMMILMMMMTIIMIIIMTIILVFLWLVVGYLVPTCLLTIMALLTVGPRSL